MWPDTVSEGASNHHGPVRQLVSLHYVFSYQLRPYPFPCPSPTYCVNLCAHVLMFPGVFTCAARFLESQRPLLVRLLTPPARSAVLAPFPQPGTRFLSHCDTSGEVVLIAYESDKSLARWTAGDAAALFGSSGPPSDIICKLNIDTLRCAQPPVSCVGR